MTTPQEEHELLAALRARLAEAVGKINALDVERHIELVVAVVLRRRKEDEDD